MRSPLFARLIPAADREAVLGDLFEDAEYRHLEGRRRALWLAGECASIAAGLSLQRVRGWVVLPPVREVVSGLAIEGRMLMRDDGGGLLRAVLFLGSVATLMLGAEVLVGSLMAAAGM